MAAGTRSFVAGERLGLEPLCCAAVFEHVRDANGRRDAFDDTSTQVMKGVGFRYLLARRLGMAAGIDVAWGPEKAAWYLSFGNSWK